MKANSKQTKLSQNSSRVSLETALMDAKVSPSPEIHTYHSEVNEEQLALKLIRNVKKEQKWVSPFARWVGQLFPEEYKEMVEADVR